ncbi:MAG: hypothetical protein HY726_03180 [Candidatus Rokubacteria bacterium]|nr:hypothetical protein [Candidatus Rokubacteria bacterium]
MRIIVCQRFITVAVGLLWFGVLEAEVVIPEPVAVPTFLTPVAREQLEQQRTGLLATRAQLDADIKAQKAACQRVPTDDADRLRTCREALTKLQDRYTAFVADTQYFARLVAVARAVRRNQIALEGFDAGLRAFAAEARAAGLVDVFEEVNGKWPILVGVVAATILDPTKTVPAAAAIVVTEMAKITAWWLNVFFQSVNRCSLPNEDLRATCLNLRTLYATVERTDKEVQEAYAALKPRPVR